MDLMAPVPPEVVVEHSVFCGICSVAHEPHDRTDLFPQCPYCGNLIDLTAHLKPAWEHGPGLKPVA